MPERDATGCAHVASWLSGLRSRCDLKVTPLKLAECTGWDFVDGRIVHKSASFFTVDGIRVLASQTHLANVEQPMINQSEIGILGFLLRRAPGGWDWLLQAKVEPGNTHGVQVGPSVQATESNYKRRHGGSPTPMVEIFLREDGSNGSIVTDIEQSEQGDRFVGKYNRNCVAMVDPHYPVPQSNLWQWFPARELRFALSQDFAVNTDARSVVVCSDWSLLADQGHLPFSRWRGGDGLGVALLRSYECDRPLHPINEVFAFLGSRRTATELSLEQVGLHDLSGWQFAADGLLPENHDRSFSVGFFSVTTSDREVACWNQPLFIGHRLIDITLVCTSIAGTLHFLLRAAVEIGFREKVQLAPTKIDDNAHSSIEWVDTALAKDAIVHACVLQSDEGGRFMDSIARYSVVEVPGKWAEESTADGIWVTLGQIRCLAARKGFLTNEARSVLSLLLAWV